MTVAAQSNIKDENCFALRSKPLSANSHPGRTFGEGCRKTEAAKRLLIKLKGSDELPLNPHRIILRKLLLGAGESTFAQLPERYFAAHGFAVGLA
jgi:hypothetical protein